MVWCNHGRFERSVASWITWCYGKEFTQGVISFCCWHWWWYANYDLLYLWKVQTLHFIDINQFTPTYLYFFLLTHELPCQNLVFINRNPPRHASRRQIQDQSRCEKIVIFRTSSTACQNGNYVKRMWYLIFIWISDFIQFYSVIITLKKGNTKSHLSSTQSFCLDKY